MTKREIAYENIINDISTRVLVPGTKLSIRSLAERYNMSEIPVREALTMLENDKLVVSVPYVGFMVASVSFEDFMESSLIRNELECLALRISITFLSEEHLQELVDLQKNLCELYEKHEFGQYTIVNRKFYAKIVSLSLCQELQHMIDTLNRRAVLRHSILMLVPYRMQHSLEEHEFLIDRIRNRDVDMAAHIMFVHRLNSLLVLTHELKEALMLPNYTEQEIVQDFFTPDELKDRFGQIGKVEYWSRLLENISSGYDPKTKCYPLK